MEPSERNDTSFFSLKLEPRERFRTRFGERAAPFTQLPPEEQDAVLENWRSSSVAFRRTAYKALFNVCAGLYLSHPATWARMGYGGPPNPKALRVAYSFNLVDLDALSARAAVPTTDAAPNADSKGS